MINAAHLLPLCFSLVSVCALMAGEVLADGSAIGQIYAPYVQPLERELELLWLDENRKGGVIPSNSLSKLGFGTSLFAGVYTEISMASIEIDGEQTQQVELEGIWQVTEQGEYSSDWGMLLEAETNLDSDISEFSVGVLNQKDWGKISLLTNVVASYEWGEDIVSEFETRLGMQARYRLRPTFEPMIEFFQGQDTTALGVGAGGLIKLSPGRQLRWGVSALKGLNPELEDAIKLELEYEFF